MAKIYKDERGGRIYLYKLLVSKAGIVKGSYWSPRLADAMEVPVSVVPVVVRGLRQTQQGEGVGVLLG